MKKTSKLLKTSSIVVALPLLLTACESMNALFGDSSRPSDNTSSYSAPESKTNKSAPVNVQAEKAKPAYKGTAVPSGTVAATVSAPVSTERKTATGTVEAPVVPSTAPTVDQ